MTRETKIGLLVGLAFIIVIGILLSDHLTSSTEPPQAALAGAGNNVRSAVTTPGQVGPQPATVTPPITVAPQNQVPTQSELTPAPNPVQIVKVGPGNTQTQTPVLAVNQSGAQQPQAQTAPTTTTPNVPQTNTDAPPITQVPPANNTNNPIEAIARAHGEEVVPLTPANPTGRTPRGGTQRMSTSTGNGAYVEYKVEAGDSLSKIASKVMGSASRTNLEAIMALNPSLKNDPNKVIVGRTYRIPTSAAAATASNTQATNNAPTQPPIAAPEVAPTKPVITTATVPASENWYTIQPGDSLWRIASEQCGAPGAIDAIKELNKDTLRGENHDIILVGTKIRLPAKAVASAN